MAILSDYFEPKLLDHMFNKAEFTRPSSLYLGVSTTAFTESDNGITAAAKEPGYNSSGPTYFGSNYSRATLSSKARYDTTSKSIKNYAGIDFAEAGGSGWGDIEYWAIFDGTGSTANMLMHGSFTAAVTVASGSQFRIGTGDLEIIFPTILNEADDLSTSSDNRFWRGQVAYLLGLNHPTGIDSNANNYFSFATENNSGRFLYLGVSTTAFPDSLSAAESSGTNYQRVYVTNSWANASTSGSGVTTISNSAAMSFPEAGSDWGDIAYWAIFRGDNTGDYDASAYTSSGSGSSSQPLLKGTLTASKTVNTGDVLRFGQGDFVVTAS